MSAHDKVTLTRGEFERVLGAVIKLSGAVESQRDIIRLSCEQYRLHCEEIAKKDAALREARPYVYVAQWAERATDEYRDKAGTFLRELDAALAPTARDHIAELGKKVAPAPSAGETGLRDAATVLLGCWKRYREESDLSHYSLHNNVANYNAWDALEKALAAAPTTGEPT